MERLIPLLVLVCSALLAQREDSMEFYRDACVRVRVVDEAGNPVAGAPVSAVFPIGDRLIPASLGTRFVVSEVAMPPLDVQAITDQKGEATLEIARGGMPLAMFAAAIGPKKMTVRVQVHAPLYDAPSVELSMGALPKEPVTLTCPRTARLHVTIARGDGTPESRPALVSVAVDSKGQGHPTRIRGVALSAERGTVSLPFVATGRRILIAARVDGEPKLRFVETELSEKALGEAVVMQPSDERADVELSGRILWPGGKPIPNQVVALRVRTGPAFIIEELQYRREDPSGSEAVRAITRTDREGRFVVKLPGVANPDPWVDTRINATLAMPWPIEAAIRTEVVLPRGLRRDKDDVGDIRLQREVTLASGTVLGLGLERISEVEVRLETLALNIWGVPLPELSQSAMQMGFKTPRLVPGAAGMTDGNGSFRLTGPPGVGPLSVVASKAGYLQTRGTPVSAATEETKVVLVPAAQLAGHVLLDPDVPRGSVTIDLSGDFQKNLKRRSEAPQWDAGALFERFGSGTSTALRSDGSFRFEALPAGTARLAVLVSNVEAEVLEAVELVEGETTRVPTFDLRGKIHTRRITVLGARHEPVKGATLSYFDKGMKVGPVRALTGADGQARIASLRESFDCRVHGPEGSFLKDDELEQVDGDRTIVLAAKTRVGVRLRTLTALVRPPYFLSCVIDPEGDPRVEKEKERHDRPFGQSERGAVLGGEGVGYTTVEKPGRYAARLMLWVIMPDLGWDVPLEIKGPNVFDLKADGSDLIEVDVDPAAVNAAVLKSAKAVFQ